MPPRIMLVAHGHPSSSKGGAEIAAHNLFQEYRRQGAECLLVARSGDPSHGGSAFSVVADGELLFHTSMSDFFLFRSADPSHISHNFRQLLEAFKPQVVHVHHYIHIGLELIPEVRRTCPDARIFLTLHEFLAICQHNGQMVKAGTHKLCHRASPKDCSACFPQFSPGDFLLRERYIKSIFDEVTALIAPSHFAKSRYVEWGIADERIHVIENGQPPAERLPARALAGTELRGRFAYFGQINPYKGVDVLLEAFASLPGHVRSALRLDIHGSGLEAQKPEFQETIRGLLRTLCQDVAWHGPYDVDQLPELLAEVDWVVVPSIWWENSPLVIQEAYKHGRAVITANIGGMAEKNRGGADMRFNAGSPASLARLMLTLPERYRNDEAYGTCVSGDVYLLEESAREHLQLYFPDRPEIGQFDLSWNRQVWDGAYSWADGGEEWSAPWGSSEAQWFGCLYPRLHRFLPADRVLEIAPGHGRWTRYLLPQVRIEYLGVDLSESCVSRCRDLFRGVEKASFHANDGVSLAMVPDDACDLVCSLDSLVHAEIEVLEAYIPQILAKLTRDGVAFIHHSNWLGSGETGANPHRRAVSVNAEAVARLVEASGGVVLLQEVINCDARRPCIDCFSLFARADGPFRAGGLIRNPRYMEEASLIRQAQSRYSQLGGGWAAAAALPPEREEQSREDSRT